MPTTTTTYTGTCVCCGVEVTGTPTRSRPRPYTDRDIITGKPQRLRMIQTADRGVHEVPA